MQATAPYQAQSVIKTPDQRLRVFVSSTLQELAEERAAVRRAVQQLRLIPVMFELGARPHAPKDLYRAYLAQSNIFIGIYFQSYGWVAPTETISGLEDEYNLSGNLPRLVYIKRPAPQIQDRLRNLLLRIQNDKVSYRQFTDAQELEDLVSNDLALLLSERFEMLQAEHSGIFQTRYYLPHSPNRLIGRESEMRMVTDWFRTDEKKLVTLLGSGGVGKTRTAIAIAEKLEQDYPDGICFITFDKISDAKLIAGFMADKLGLPLHAGQPAFEAIRNFLSEKKMMLVLDNLEHLLPDIALLISELLQAASGVVILATSRIPLDITMEQQLQIEPLRVPPGKPSLGDALKADAVRFFDERVKSVKPEFIIDNNNLDDVLGICRRLDGLPLALELAAARMRLFTPKQLAQRLASNFDLLKDGPRDLPDRQRTMRNVVAWSYNLLNEKQREAYHALSAFISGVTYDAAERVCGDEAGDLMDVLMSLVAQNLLRLKEEESSEIRFAMYDTIREFGMDKLKESGKLNEVLVKHALHYIDWVKHAYAAVEADPIYWTRLVKEELGNIRLALDTSLRLKDNTLPKGAAASLAGDMVLFWNAAGLIPEGKNWLDRALAESRDIPEPMLVHALWAAGSMALSLGNFTEGEQLSRESLNISVKLNDLFLVANSQRTLAKALTELGKYEEALSLLESSLKTYRELKDNTMISRALHAMGNIWMRQGFIQKAREAFEEDMNICIAERNILSLPLAYISLGTTLEKEGNYAEAKKHYMKGLELDKKYGDNGNVARDLNNFANILFHNGDFSEAKKTYSESLAIKQKVGDQHGIATSLGNLGWVAFMEGNYDEAKQYHTRSIAIKRKIGYTRGVAVSLQGLALATLYQGDYKETYYLLHEGIGLARQSGDRVIIAGMLEIWSLLDEQQNKLVRSAQLFGAAAGIRESCKAPSFRNDKIRNDALEARLRKQLGDERFTEEFNEGKLLNQEQAVQFALEE